MASVTFVPTRAALAALTGQAESDAITLTEAGREGLFVWRAADQSGLVAQDTQQGVAVAPNSAPSGGSGAWLRVVTGDLNAKWFGALGDGVTDDQVALSAALVVASYERPALHLPAGTYLHSYELTVNGVRLYGDGPAQTVLKATATGNQPHHALIIAGTGASITDLATNTDGSFPRQSADWTSGISVSAGATLFVIDKVAVSLSASAGIIVRNATQGRIGSVSITDTNADGLHFTGGSNTIQVERVVATNTGDDGVAIVSYAAETVCQQIQIDEVIVQGGLARGLSVVGGQSIQIGKLSATGVTDAGLYLASEPTGSQATQGVQDVSIGQALIAGCGSNSGQIYAAVQIVGDNPGQQVRRVSIDDLTIVNSRSNALLVGVGSAAGDTADIRFGRVRIDGVPNGSAVYFYGCSDVAIDSLDAREVNQYGVVAASNNAGFLRIGRLFFESLNQAGTGFIDAVNLDGSGFQFVELGSLFQRNGTNAIERLIEMIGSPENVTVGSVFGDNVTCLLPDGARRLILNRQVSGTSQPTSGSWNRGDFILNELPSTLGASGAQYVVLGWVCVADGSPGTWVAANAPTGS